MEYLIYVMFINEHKLSMLEEEERTGGMCSRIQTCRERTNDAEPRHVASQLCTREAVDPGSRLFKQKAERILCAST
jgi:hypothetical protein